MNNENTFDHKLNRWQKRRRGGGGGKTSNLLQLIKLHFLEDVHEHSIRCGERTSRKMKRDISLGEDACRSAVIIAGKAKHFSSRIELRENLAAAIKRADDDETTFSVALNCCVVATTTTTDDTSHRARNENENANIIIKVDLWNFMNLWSFRVVLLLFVWKIKERFSASFRTQ